MIPWPPPCPTCGSDIKQQTEWSTDALNFKQKCHVCGYQGDWEPYPPARNRGFTYTQIEKAMAVRTEALLDARERLVLAKTLSLHSPELRDEIDHVIQEIDECLARWTALT